MCGGGQVPREKLPAREHNQHGRTLGWVDGTLCDHAFVLDTRLGKSIRSTVHRSTVPLAPVGSRCDKALVSDAANPELNLPRAVNVVAGHLEDFGCVRAQSHFVARLWDAHQYACISARSRDSVIEVKFLQTTCVLRCAVSVRVVVEAPACSQVMSASRLRGGEER